MGRIHFAALICPIPTEIDLDAVSLNTHAVSPAGVRQDYSYDLERICRAKNRKRRCLPRSLATRLFVAATPFGLS